MAMTAASDGNPNSVSDAGVAAACALAAAEGAALNVRINVPALTDRAVADDLLARQDELLGRARNLATQVRGAVDAILGRARV
jgi:glutamate formiminotransferase/formiminotetrahydrofolate cyclodeaminase